MKKGGIGRRGENKQGKCRTSQAEGAVGSKHQTWIGREGEKGDTRFPLQGSRMVGGGKASTEAG